MIEVLQPGMLTTVQDLGRDGYTHLGVSPAGAADRIALRAGNLLCGNAANAAALELTLTPSAFLFHDDAVVAVCGAVPNWSSFAVAAGQTIEVPAAASGARTYLCVHGELDVPGVLGSMSTHLPSGLGGFEGRALRKGDRISIKSGSLDRRDRSLPSCFTMLTQRRRRLRVTAGPHAHLCGPMPLAAFRVQSDSNRQGLRLTPNERLHYPGEIMSQGVALGSIQVLPDGKAVILFVDSQTTGGYPVIASVISADLASVGQLRPGDEVEFMNVSMDEAREALREQERLLHELTRELA